MKKIVVLSGAGISAESGLATFRDSGGLWEGYEVMDVASIDGWIKNRKLVLDFYNMRRKDAFEAQPNEGHKALVRLEEKFEVSIVTQNVDNLHERAGSKKIIHLHGELFKSRSTIDPRMVFEMKELEINIGDLCPKGSQLRPHIVWFGEAVPMMDAAIMEVSNADIIIVVGTSLQVYPAAGLIDYAKDQAQLYIIDPNMPKVKTRPNQYFIHEKGSVGLSQLANTLLNEL